MTDALTKTAIHGIDVVFGSYRDRIDCIAHRRESGSLPVTVCYANAHTIVLAWRDENFRAAIREFSLVFADGVGVYFAAKALAAAEMARQLPQNATDFNYSVFRHAHEQGMRLYILGGTQAVVAEVASRIEREYPGIVIAGTNHGYCAIDDPDVVHRINAARPDLLVVGMGHPKQELWVTRQKASLTVPVILVVGGLLDFYSGAARRSPMFLQRAGLEWLHRLLREPRRLWKRYIIGIPIFIYLVFREKIQR